MASRAPAAKQRRREEIVDAATGLLGKQGYGLTTMDDIAAAAHITKRTLYRYVPTKQDVLPMIHERFLCAAEELHRMEDNDIDPVQRMSTFIKLFAKVLVEHQTAVRVFFEEQYNLAPEAREAIVARRDSFEATFRALVRAGQRAGSFRDFDVEIATFGIFGAVGSVYLWYSPSGDFGSEQLSSAISQLLVTGLVEEVPRSPRNAKRRAPLSERSDLGTGSVPVKVPVSVLEAAARLFATQGYLETNTRQIAETAGVTKSGLFYHIGSKEDLLYTLNHQFALARLDSLQQIRTDDATQDPAARLRSLVMNHSRVMGDHPYLVRLSLDQSRYLSATKRHHIEALHAEYVDGFERVLLDGIDAGIFKKVNPHVATLTLLGMINWMSRWYEPGRRLTSDQVGAVFADLFLYGLALPRDSPGFG